MPMRKEVCGLFSSKNERRAEQHRCSASPWGDDGEESWLVFTERHTEAPRGMSNAEIWGRGGRSPVCAS